MDNNKNNMIIRKMATKIARLESGLKKLVDNFLETDGDKYLRYYAYDYACGCLGGEYVKNQLVKSKNLKKVVEELLANKYISEINANKLLEKYDETSVVDEKHMDEEAAKAKDESKRKSSQDNTVTFSYNPITKTTNPYALPQEYRVVHDVALSAWMVFKWFQDEITVGDKIWELSDCQKVSDNEYRITYSQRKEDFAC